MVFFTSRLNAQTTDASASADYIHTEQSPSPAALDALLRAAAPGQTRRGFSSARVSHVGIDRLRPKKGVSMKELARSGRLLADVDEAAAAVQRTISSTRADADLDETHGADPMLWTRTQEQRVIIAPPPTKSPAPRSRSLMSLFF